MSPRLLERVASEYIHRAKKKAPLTQNDSFVKVAEEILYKLWGACGFQIGTTPGYMTTESHQAREMAFKMQKDNIKRLLTEGMKDDMFGFGAVHLNSDPGKLRLPRLRRATLVYPSEDLVPLYETRRELSAFRRIVNSQPLHLSDGQHPIADIIHAALFASREVFKLEIPEG
jgi:hypothetical protein